MGKLTAIAIKTAMGTGTLHDGEGVRLQMRGIGKGSWIFRFQLKGRTREMGLGTYPEVTLAEARQKAADARKLTRAGIDPIEARKTADREAGTARRPTFEQAAEELIKAKEKGWGNPKTAYRWRARLRDYAFPIIGKKDCAAITASDVVRCLSPIWYEKTETAVKTRGYIEAVLDYAGVKGWRERGQNPAAWRGNLEHLGLRARKDFDAVEHHPAMPYVDLPAFMIRLRTQTAFTARALEFLILTACRAGEVREATWAEIDLESATWTISKARQLKQKQNRRDHRVPLATQVVALLRELPRVGELAFPGTHHEKPFSDMAFNMLMRRMQIKDYHCHGFRSSFKDWSVEKTDVPDLVSEMALAHDVGSGTVKAYRRSDLFEKRRVLMQAWADFCYAETAKGRVSPLRAKAR